MERHFVKKLLVCCIRRMLHSLMVFCLQLRLIDVQDLGTRIIIGVINAKILKNEGKCKNRKMEILKTFCDFWV